MAKIAEALHAMGVIVIVDGAHAPGHLPLGKSVDREFLISAVCFKTGVL